MFIGVIDSTECALMGAFQRSLLVVAVMVAIQASYGDGASYEGARRAVS
jgi:hypothetical protein